MADGLKQSIQLITFDLDNTLWETDPIIYRAEQASYDALIAAHPDIASLYTLEGVRQYKSDLAECYPSLVHQVSKIRFETLRRIALQAGLFGDEAERIAQIAFDAFYHERSQVTPFEQAFEKLEQLSEIYSLIALTNGNADLEMIGIHHLFDAHYNGEEIGAAKPAPDMFEAALKKAGVEARQAVHVGDHPEQDIQAARDLGFHTIWVNVLEKEWPQELTPADLSINHLSELPAAIEHLSNSLAGS